MPLKMYPSDIPNPQTYPADVTDYYLCEENMTKDLSADTNNHSKRSKRRNPSVLNFFSTYSEENTRGTHLNTGTIIKEVLTKEVMKMTQSRTYMDILQVFGLATVLQRPVFSAYPNLENPIVRQDLDRLILPRTSAQTPVPDDKPLITIWTSTRCDMTNTH